MQYELFYLIGERQEANLEAIREEVKQMLVSEKATLLEPELIEKRKMAYEIKHQKKGTYITRRFELPEMDELVDENAVETLVGIESITRKLNLNNNVLRAMIVKTTDLPELGAKEKRQKQEQQGPKEAKRPEAKPTRTERRPYTPAPKPAVAKVASEKPVAKKEVEKTAKVAGKDIDKQLDELLNN